MWLFYTTIVNYYYINKKDSVMFIRFKPYMVSKLPFIEQICFDLVSQPPWKVWIKYEKNGRIPIKILDDIRLEAQMCRSRQF